MKILVVDDERDIQILFEQKFRKEIKENLMSFSFAFSGEEALSYLEQQEHGADDFLTKPIEFNLLKEKLNTVR